MSMKVAILFALCGIVCVQALSIQTRQDLMDFLEHKLKSKVNKVAEEKKVKVEEEKKQPSGDSLLEALQRKVDKLETRLDSLEQQLKRSNDEVEVRSDGSSDESSESEEEGTEESGDSEDNSEGSDYSETEEEEEEEEDSGTEEAGKKALPVPAKISQNNKIDKKMFTQLELIKKLAEALELESSGTFRS